MINRLYLKCNTCNGNITARVQVGFEPESNFTFNCPYCNEKIIFKQIVNIRKITVKYEYIENCSEGDQEGEIIYFSSDFAPDKNKRGDEQYFPFFTYDLSLFGTQEGSYSIIDRLFNNWMNLKRYWSLTINEKERIALKFSEKYIFLYSKEFSPKLNSQIYDFTIFFLLPKKYEYLFEVYNLVAHAASRQPKR